MKSSLSNPKMWRQRSSPGKPQAKHCITSKSKTQSQSNTAEIPNPKPNKPAQNVDPKPKHKRFSL